MNKLKERVEREREWHDERFTEDTRDKTTSVFYLALKNWYQDYLDICQNNDSNNVLELGAGLETISIGNKLDYNLTSVDISSKAIEYLKSKNLGHNINFELADVHEMPYADDSFGFVVARGVLHHLDLKIGINEIKRVLKKDGKVIFGEPLAGNLLIRIYRYLTPNLRTPDEEPLSNKDINFVKKSFKNVTVNYYGFITLIFAILGRKYSPFAKRCDDLILNRLRLGKYLAWACIIRN
tara:strand:- start:2418 stop:3131 length:714 start_codon:yes stop_codon:yes gene_type:complete